MIQSGFRAWLIMKCTTELIPSCLAGQWTDKSIIDGRKLISLESVSLVIITSHFIRIEKKDPELKKGISNISTVQSYFHKMQPTTSTSRTMGGKNVSFQTRRESLKRHNDDDNEGFASWNGWNWRQRRRILLQITESLNFHFDKFDKYSLIPFSGAAAVFDLIRIYIRVDLLDFHLRSAPRKAIPHSCDE